MLAHYYQCCVYLQMIHKVCVYVGTLAVKRINVYQFKLTVRAIVIALKLQKMSFCQDS